VRSLQYCPVRKELEEKQWCAIERYSSAALRLIELVGRTSRRNFLTVHSECWEAKAIISHTRFSLDSHRSEHGC